MDTGFFAPDVEFSPGQGHRPDEWSATQKWMKISATVVASATVSVVLAFCQPPADLTEAELNAAVVREARPVPRRVPISPDHLKVIEDYRARHVEMPPTEADRRIRPYYGI